VISLPGDLGDRVDADGGDFARRKVLGVRKCRGPVRPRRSFEARLGELGSLRVADSPTASPVWAVPLRFGVETLRKTASLYRSTTPRANKLVAFAPLRSSPAASIKSQSSSSSRSVRTSSSSFASERSRSSAGTPDFSRRLRWRLGR